MNGSILIGRYLGIRVYLHFTFILFIAVIGWLGYRSGDGYSLPVFTLACFLCVLFHEYGHALMARRYGIPTHDITLLPIGGIARLARIPTEPRQELLVALAGPAVNLLIILLLLPACAFLRYPIVPTRAFLSGEAPLLSLLMWWNGSMILFNMLPAFPMDGGRVFRAVLALRLPYERATAWASLVGKAMALIFVGYVFSTQSHFLLLFIAFFVWTGAGQELLAAREHVALLGATVRDGMLVDFHRLNPADPTSHAVDLIIRGWQTDFPILAADGSISGVATRQGIVRAYSQDPALPVSAYALPISAHCAPQDPLDPAVQRMRELGLPILPVMEDGVLLGLLTHENTAEFIALRRAFRLRMPAAEQPPEMKA